MKKDRTFKLNGADLPCPISTENVFVPKPGFFVFDKPFQFDNAEDAEKVKDAIIKMLEEARDKL